MALPVTMYRWDDPGAPQITEGRPSEFINVFKKCLVEGYGDKQPLGWQIQFEGALNQVSFVNDIATGGSGGSYVLKSENGADEIGEKVIIQCCQSFVDFDNLVQASPKSTYKMKGGTFGYDLFPEWLVIGTSNAFYFITKMTNQTSVSSLNYLYYPAFFVGDFDKIIPSDQNRFILFGGYNGLNDHTNPGSSEYLSGQLVDSGSSSSIKGYTLESPPNFWFFTVRNLFGVGGNSIKNDTAKRETPEITFMSPSYIFNSYSDTHHETRAVNYNSATNPVVRGIMPGLFASQEVGYFNEPLYFIKSINNQLHLNLPSTGDRASAVWINLEQW
ncbi:hypothetical protein HJP15_18945 [Pseudoalteromonas sp. NEC-BIFX-2020_002]|uniref:hypothetical protein n=1 Tax=Pseudoalteromonas sp. NEC-BIFX-2020_002 TaxID=2732353 RepID=UPI001476C0F3|nr:hypothetical protein [Pseudoalteromonas sp. NEC-BIFX-2020_002]NNG44969.1 hypothetical protein [Pseudoalteromonas sp. NEC-BIFX-2020_002]